jgi:broad specificity phosphatase PhoE
MTSLVLIPWARTDWADQGRLASRTPLPLNAHGRAEVIAWGDALAARELSVVYSSRELTACETAALVVQRSEARHRVLDGLEEVDFGFWEGLNPEVLTERFPRRFKTWLDDPAAICAPGGEELPHAAVRIQTALHHIARKHRGQVVGAVMAPLALAVARCVLDGAPLERARAYVVQEPVGQELDLSDRAAGPGVPSAG